MGSFSFGSVEPYSIDRHLKPPKWPPQILLETRVFQAEELKCAEATFAVWHSAHGSYTSSQIWTACVGSLGWKLTVVKRTDAPCLYGGSDHVSS